MKLEKLIEKYKLYIDNLDFIGMYNEAINNGDYIDNDSNFFELIFEIEEILEEDGLTIYHQAKSNGYDTVIINPYSWDDYVMEIHKETNCSIDDSVTFLSSIYEQYKQDFLCIEIDGVEFPNIRPLIDKCDSVKIVSVRVGLSQVSGKGLCYYMIFELDTGSLLVMYYQLKDVSCAYSFRGLGGAINTQKTRDKVRTIFDSVLNR